MTFKDKVSQIKDYSLQDDILESLDDNSYNSMLMKTRQNE